MTTVLLFGYAGNAGAVLGIPDHVPAATLIVPYFEVGINSATHPHDTLPVVTNAFFGTVTVHYEIWDVFGNLVDAFGNFTLGPIQTAPFSMRSLIAPLSGSQKTQLTDGAFYRGFVTYDVVTAPTDWWPTNASYPFGFDNVLEGWIYYVRLPEGSSNGLSMLPVEATPGGTPFELTDFYQFGDGREEFDATARASVESLSRGGSVVSNPQIARVRSRVYLTPANNASSKIIIFAFPQQGFFVPPGVVPYKRYDESGNLLQDTTVNLDRVVNVIQVSGTSNGFVSIWDIPDAFSTYGFSINTANPGFDPSLTWDAIFESFILP